MDEVPRRLASAASIRSSSSAATAIIHSSVVSNGGRHGAAGAVPSARHEAVGADLGRWRRLHHDFRRSAGRRRTRCGRSDLTVPASERKSVSWKTGGANIAGLVRAGAFGTDGTIYVALGIGASGGGTADSIVALDRDTLRSEGLVHRARRRLQRDAHRHSPQGPGSDRGDGERRAVVRCSMRASLGGIDHRTPLRRDTTKFTDSRRRHGARDVRRRKRPLDLRDRLRARPATSGSRRTAPRRTGASSPSG